VPFHTLSAATAGDRLALVADASPALELIDVDHPSQPIASLPGAQLARLATDGATIVGLGDGVRAWRIGGDGTARPLGVPSRRWIDMVPCGERWCALDAAHRLCELASPLDPPSSCVPAEGNASMLAPDAQTGTVWLVSEPGDLEAHAMRGLGHTAGLIRPRTVARQSTSRLAVERGRGAVIDGVTGMLRLLDLTTAPRARGTFLLQARPAGVALSHGVALVAEPSAGLQLVDLSDPERLKELAWQPLEPGPEAVAVAPAASDSGARLVAVAQGEGGVSLWEWDGRAALRLLRQADTSGYAGDVAFAGGSLWVADGASLVQFPLSGASR
jgi:hypothetical protein